MNARQDQAEEKPPDTPADSETRGRKRARQSTPKSVKIANGHSHKSSRASSSSSWSASDAPPSFISWLRPPLAWLSGNLEWVGENWTWSKIKPAIRCAVVGWLSTVLFVIPRVEVFLGQASFLILIASFLSPASDPFPAVLERETLILLFVNLAWAWVTFGIFLADLARSVHDPTVTFFQAATGEYIEAAPTVILAVFIFFGSSFFLYIKARQGPGPYTFASVFACICIDISLTTAVLFPFPYYMIGRAIVLPLVFHTAIALLASVFVFPSTISALFTDRLISVLTPLLASLSQHQVLLDTSLTSPDFPRTLAAMRTETKKCEGALVPLAAAARLLKSDLIYARFAPDDFRPLQGMCRRLAGRADGMGVYFGLVDPAREMFPGTGAASGAGTPAPTMPSTPNVMSRATSRAASLERVETRDGEKRHDSDRRDSETHTPSSLTSGTPLALATSRHSVSMPTMMSLTPATSRPPTRPPSIHPSHSTSYSHLHLHRPHLHHHHTLLHNSLVSLAKARAPKYEYAVGTFESQRYLNLEATRLHDDNEEEYTSRCVELLKESCTPLVSASQLGLTTVSSWLSTVRAGRISHVFDTTIRAVFGSRLRCRATEREERRRKAHSARVEELRRVREVVSEELEMFREETRHLVLEPYRPAFENHNPDEHANGTAWEDPKYQPQSPSHTPTTSTPTPTNEPNSPNPVAEEFRQPSQPNGAVHDADHGAVESAIPPHRYLFNCYVYQYNLIQVSSIAIEMLDHIITLEEERPWPHCRLWTPVERVFRWNPWLVPEGVEQNEDDDPDVIQGLHHDRQSSPTASKIDVHASHSCEQDLGLPRRRDPDALPPRNLFELLLGLIYKFIVGLGGGNAVFAIKAGLFTVVLCLPSLLKSSAGFAFQNRFVWAVFMGQLTLARFRGDTAFGFTARIMSTFGGGITGMVMWYVSCGSGRGNAFGLTAVCAVCFPFFFFARLYWPVAPMTNMVFFVTAVLVVGYSYQDEHVIAPGSPGSGWSVAWRRFVLVTVGVAAAFITSFLPPSTTIRRYHRNLLATTSNEIGSIYCAILSFANTKHEPEIQEIISSLIAIRSKLTRSAAVKTNVIYEFSLRGRWPAERYQKIADLQMAISYSLSHLMSVLEHLESSWARAFLRRTRFMDPDFQGDILAVISMISSSLRTGCPLPQITPCPLLDRFMLQYHGLNVIHKEAEEDYGLPRSLTMDTLRNEQYLMFCVGISTAFGIINRLDRLMLAVKEVVGEQYHIHGVGMVTVLPAQAPPPASISAQFGSTRGGNYTRGGGVELGERSSTVHFEPPRAF